MIPVEEARRRILAAFAVLPAETVALSDSLGRVLATDGAARRTQPWAALSAMDGYAVRAGDLAQVPAVLTEVGRVPAGRAFADTVGPGECVRIFTGAPLPDGTDAIVIQEDAEADGDRITVREAVPAGRFVRPAGLDFREGDVLLPAGTLMTARRVGLAAAMNLPWLRVRRRPRVAILATGDEIVMPGEPIGPSQIVSANGPSLAAVVAACGGVAINLGIAPDDPAELARRVADARGADLLVTTGGASVGEHDLIREGLGAGAQGGGGAGGGGAGGGLALDFWRIAMRPGKPLMFGRIGDLPLLGLPGNPVSTLVCALLFLRPALLALQGLTVQEKPATARLGRALDANDRRQDYLRSRLDRAEDGALVATPFDRQDSSMVATLADAGCLAVRPPHAPPAAAGETIEIVPFDAGLLRL